MSTEAAWSANVRAEEVSDSAANKGMCVQCNLKGAAAVFVDRSDDLQCWSARQNQRSLRNLLSSVPAVMVIRHQVASSWDASLVSGWVDDAVRETRPGALVVC